MIMNHNYNGEVVATTVINNCGQGVVELHSKVLKFSKNIYYFMLGEFEEIKSFLKSKGFKQIVVTHDNPDKRLLKYWEMFGFMSTKKTMVDNMEITYSLMEL